ncbi:hypothetical protein GCM10009844_17530 [Nocardioides koreensis]|uniref:Bifunctional metallophosphatase/5'-nucleotidase n=2 Tax=Nocardioides koreensis TaxID=433651 RepID=A0ABP5LAL8_9ACTN
MAAAPLAVVAVPAHAADPVEVNLLGINDFHGRIRSNGVEAGAAVLAGAVDQIRTQHPHTVFAAAGDLIGASTFESFIDHDKPTIDALNEAGLEVSAVGNHELDQGYDDLVHRVMAAESADNPDGGAAWQYLGANLRRKADHGAALPESWTRDFDGVTVGFVGAVTEHLPELVSPAGIADLEVEDVVTAANRTADRLKAQGADLVVLLVHEGAPGTDCATMDDDPGSDFGSVITGVDANVDAILSGHTHLAYDCRFPVAAWAGRPVTERPVVSAGQYGYNLNQLTFSVDPTTGRPLSLQTSLLPLTTRNADGSWTAGYPADPATSAIVDDAVAAAEVEGATPLGDLAGPFQRARKSDGSENRGGESTLGNLVAEVQRWATRGASTGAAQIAFMNPGGLRADLLGSTPGSYPSTLTYQQAATVQPFANTLVNMDLTGAQLRAVLEQQWQPAGASRPFLRLGTSRGFRYVYDPSAAAGRHVTGMWLHGIPVDAAQTYSVTVNSFLASGGDNFTGFADGTGRQDTGRTDLQALVDHLARFRDGAALPVDDGQRAVGVHFPDGAPAWYHPGSRVSFDLSSLAFTGPGDRHDDHVDVSVGDKVLGTFPVDSIVGDDVYDEHGTAEVSVVLPTGSAHRRVLTVTGDTTGTTVKVPVRVAKWPALLKAEATPRRAVAGETQPVVRATVTAGLAPASGKVLVRTGGRRYTARLVNGTAVVTLEPYGRVGRKKVRVAYLGTPANRMTNDATTIRVVKVS